MGGEIGSQRSMRCDSFKDGGWHSQDSLVHTPIRHGFNHNLTAVRVPFVGITRSISASLDA